MHKRKRKRKKCEWLYIPPELSQTPERRKQRTAGHEEQHTVAEHQRTVQCVHGWTEGDPKELSEAWTVFWLPRHEDMRPYLVVGPALVWLLGQRGHLPKYDSKTPDIGLASELPVLPKRIIDQKGGKINTIITYQQVVHKNVTTNDNSLHK